MFFFPFDQLVQFGRDQIHCHWSIQGWGPFHFPLAQENKAQSLLSLLPSLQTLPAPLLQICMGNKNKKDTVAVWLKIPRGIHHFCSWKKTVFILLRAWIPPNIVFISSGANLAFQGTELMCLSSQLFLGPCLQTTFALSLVLLIQRSHFTDMMVSQDLIVRKKLFQSVGMLAAIHLAACFLQGWDGTVCTHLQRSPPSAARQGCLVLLLSPHWPQFEAFNK